MTERPPGTSSDPSSSVTPGEIRVFVVAPATFYGEGLAELLPGHRDLEVVGVAADPAEAVRSLRETAPDVVLIDHGFPHGLDLARGVRSDLPEAQVVVVAVRETSGSILPWAEAGVSAYVSQRDSITDIATVIRDTVNGELHCSPEIAAQAFERLYALSVALRATDPPSAALRLTDRERGIVALIDRGLSNKRISRKLGISLSTTKNHVQSILKKLNVNRRGEAAAIVREWEERASWGGVRTSASDTRSA